MFNRISTLILSILLFMVLLGSAASLQVLVLALSILILGVLAVNYKRVGLIWPHLLLPTFYLLGVGSIFSVISSPTWRLVFLIAACLVFYVMEMELGRESHFLQNVFLFSVLAIFIGLFAIQFYFHLYFLWLVLSIFILSYLLIVQGFAGFSLPVKKYFSLLIALVIAETAWGLSLWPTYFVVNAIITFAIFYLLWIFSFSAFFGKLTRNKIYWQLSLTMVIIAVVIATANFKPLTR